MAIGTLMAMGNSGKGTIEVTMPDGTVKTVEKKGGCRNKLHPSIPAFARESMKETRGPGLFDYSFPSKGKQKVLVILVEFSDVQFNSKNKSPYNTIDAKTFFTDMLNKEGFDTYEASGSARDWFLQNSNGMFEPEFDVYGPVTLSQNMKYYGGNDSLGDDQRPYQMIIDACNALDNEVDFKEYDRDGNGYVDNVYVFYAGYGEADYYGDDCEDTIWPHAWEISSAAPNRRPLQLDGVYIDRYACSNETIGYGVRKDCPDGIGTFVHEFSHVLGLPDLYCTDDNLSSDKEPFTPGDYSILDYGSYNNEGLTPPNYSAYERYALDWIVPEMLVSGEHQLVNIADSNKAYIVKTDREQEFYLLENRQQTGWDEYIPGHGMLVWHIDFDESVFYYGYVNNTKDHQYVDLIEADNVQSSRSQAADPFPGTKNVTSFGFSTTPSLQSWSGLNLGVDLTNIAENEGLITFTAEVDAENQYNGSADVKEIIIEEVMTSAEIFNMQGIHVGTMIDGNIPLLAPGVYIFKSGNHTLKRIVR